MNWIVGALVTPILNWLGGVIAKGANAAYSFYAEYQKRKQAYEDSVKQSKIVEDIAEQIMKLRKEGKPVPPELQRRLVDESTKIDIGERFP